MLDMGGGGGGCGLAVAAVVVILLVIAAVALFLPAALADLQDASARRIEAREGLEHTRNLDRQQSFMLFTTALAAFTSGGRGDAVLIVAIVVCVVLLLGVVKMLLNPNYQ